jgi:hypothetical protein
MRTHRQFALNIATKKRSENAVMNRPIWLLSVTMIAVGLASAPRTYANEASELAQQLSNPIASLISVPLQANYDSGYGPTDDGSQFKLNIQPVLPFDLNDDWNVISRTILPIIDQRNLFPGAGSQSGVGDVVQSLFFSPKRPTARGMIWGVGPVFLLPTASDELLGSEKWGMGPTAVALVQRGAWTVGALANHIWSVGGADDRSDINVTLLQPFASYTTPTAWTYSFNTESTYDWEGEHWLVPINVAVSKLTKLGPQPISLGAGVRYWAEAPNNGPEDWGIRLTATLLYPK